MNAELTQVVLYLALLLGLAYPLGWFMAQVYEGRTPFLGFLRPLERFLYRVCGIEETEETDWKRYAVAVLAFNLAGFLAVYALQRLQAVLPLNPQGFPAPSPDLSFNTAVSFMTNTNWQAYGGENTLSYLVQMAALGVQNFLSAASGMAVLVALIRGLIRKETHLIGNFWVDMTRTTLYILLPSSLILALALASQGVLQNFKPYDTAQLLQAGQVKEQTLPMGPVASQVAIKQVGTNGGGFFNANSAHPFENATPLSDFLEMLAIPLLAAALCLTFGIMVKDVRQGWMLLAAMTVMFVPLVWLSIHSETAANPAIARLGVDPGAGNMEGKETRFGAVNSALWATATTVTSNGSVNSMHDSFTPLGGLVALFDMQLGEVVYGGVGCGLYGMLIFVMVTVFVAGLMVGRTPEYLGKKIQSYEMQMASIAILIMPVIVLVATAVAVVTAAGKAGASNPGAHGFSQILYAFTSQGNNNGSAFAGVNANTPFYNALGGLCMLAGRFLIKLPVLAIAGSLAAKKIVPPSPGTLPTHTPLFLCLLVGVVVIVGALTFVPALALGPVVEHLTMLGY